MFVFLVTLAAAQSAALISTPPATATAPTAVTQAPARKPRKKKCATGDEPSLGSHIYMDSCMTAQEQEDAAAKGVRDYRAFATESRGDVGAPR